MKNTTYKILLLVAGIVIAMAAILVYIQTIVAPPTHEEDKIRQYDQKVEKDISNLRNCEIDSLEIEFQYLSDFLDRLIKESKINQSDFDNHYVDFISDYAPRFADYCFGQFQKPKWDDNDLDFITAKIKHLQSLRVYDGAQNILALGDLAPTNQRFNNIMEILDEYHKARALCSNYHYTGSVADAKRRIDQSKKYLQHPVLANNVYLVGLLNAFPKKLGESHYTWLKSQINRLSSYPSYSSLNEYYDNVWSNISHELDILKSNQKIYGININTQTLQQEIDNYYNIARNYYYNISQN